MTTGTIPPPGKPSPDHDPPLVAGNLLSAPGLSADTSEATDFRLENVLQTVVRVFNNKANASQTRLLTHIDPDLPAIVSGHEASLNQILCDFVGIALDSAEKNAVKLRARQVRRSDAQVTIEFEITGFGVGRRTPAVAAEHGIVIGGLLSATCQLVERQGGLVYANSQAGAATFTVLLSFGLPVAAHTSGFYATPTDNHVPHSLANARILLVEGNRIDQLVARKFLEKWGASVEIARNGLEAIEKLRFTAFDVVLMDLQMPGMDGYHTARHIRHRMETPVKNIPIVALTITDTPKVRRRAMEAGINDFVAKPFDPRDLHLKMLKFAGCHFISGAISPLPVPVVAPLAAYVGPQHVGLQYVNLQYLEEISADNKAFVSDMIRLFIQQMPQFVRKLRAACETADWQAMRYLIHKMKSSLATIGIFESEPVIRQLEMHAFQETQAHENLRLVWQIEEICEKAYGELHAKLAEAGF